MLSLSKLGDEQALIDLPIVLVLLNNVLKGPCWIA